LRTYIEDIKTSTSAGVRREATEVCAW
jgi:hypothetical protein